jgi:hypothetical protein
VAFLGLAVIVFAIARNTGGDSDQARGGGASATPPPTSDLPFSDQFSNTSSAWRVQKNEDAGSYYDDGGYRVYSPAMKARAVPRSEAGPFPDVAVEVDAKVLNNQSDFIASGVLCREQDQDTFYSMLVFGNGVVSIDKIMDASRHEIVSKNRSEVIGENVVSPHIRGECVGNRLTLYVNDKKVLEAEDSDIRSGGVGLVASSYDANLGAKILFDNFSVKKP